MPKRMVKKKRPGVQRPKSPGVTRAEIHALFNDVENPKQRAFLAAYVKTKRTLAASALTGVSRETHYYWLKSDPQYCEHWRRARKMLDRKSTRLNSSHGYISYAVFCLK